MRGPNQKKISVQKKSHGPQAQDQKRKEKTIGPKAFIDKTTRARAMNARAMLNIHVKFKTSLLILTTKGKKARWSESVGKMPCQTEHESEV